MSSATIAPGSLVEHVIWGRGKVLAVSGPYVTVHFLSLAGTPQGPVRKLQLGAPQLKLSPVQSDPALDHVQIGTSQRPAKTKPQRSRAKPTLHTLEQAIAWFQTAFPGRFADSRLIEEELGYKRDAHNVFVTRFGQGRGRKLLDTADLAAVADGLSQLYHATNIPSRFEIMAANDGLKDIEAAGRLLESLLDFLDDPEAASFDRLVGAVASLPAPADGSRVLTWPNVTILPFLADPTRFMVLKPAITRRIASRMGVDLVYSSPPKWHTYEALLAMSGTLLERLAPLGAKDYIDVQSFIWVTQVLD